VKVSLPADTDSPAAGQPTLSAPGQSPPAVAPFNAAAAKTHQQAWAEHLGVPVEMENSTGMKLALIPAGEFMMGSKEEERTVALAEAKSWSKGRVRTEGPQHKVKITKPFYLGKYEVTQTQWEAMMGNNPSEFQGPDNPVEQVSWNDVQKFLTKMNVAFEKKGMVFGLPTEAGWEYACRAGTTTSFYFGDNPALLKQHGWFSGNARATTHPVGQGKPNAWGLYDMHGNVEEWCSDWNRKTYYEVSPPVDPVGPPSGEHRVFRGGGFRDAPVCCRSAYRDYTYPNRQAAGRGFRLALIRPGE